MLKKTVINIEYKKTAEKLQNKFEYTHCKSNNKYQYDIK